MAKKGNYQEEPGEFWDKVHYKRRGNVWTLCNRSARSLKTTTNKRKVTCKTCKGLLRYEAKVQKQGHF